VLTSSLSLLYFSMLNSAPCNMFLYSVLVNQELQYRPLSNNSQRYAPYINTGPHNKVQYPNNRYKYNHSHLLSCFGFHSRFHLCSVSTNKANTPKELCKITKTHVIKSVYGNVMLLAILKCKKFATALAVGMGQDPA